MPDRQKIRQLSHLQPISRLLHDPNIFHFTRRSAAGGVATGLFMAFVPFPGQSLFAALVSILFRVNLPLAVAFTWVTNPLTVPPAFYLAYSLGATILGHPMQRITFEMSWESFSGTFMEIWPSLITGSLVLATISSVSGYVVVRVLWRLAVIQKWKRRKNTRIRQP